MVLPLKIKNKKPTIKIHLYSTTNSRLPQMHALWQGRYLQGILWVGARIVTNVTGDECKIGVRKYNHK